MSSCVTASPHECHTHTLSILPVGNPARIQSVDVEHTLRRRLQELGLVPGTQIQCLFRSYSGDPSAFLVRGTVLALRRRDSDHIWIQPE